MSDDEKDVVGVRIKRKNGEIARLQKELNELKEKRHAMQRNLYSTETVEKLEWRKETLMEHYKKALDDLKAAVKDASVKVVEWTEGMVVLRAYLDALDGPRVRKKHHT